MGIVEKANKYFYYKNLYCRCPPLNSNFFPPEGIFSADSGWIEIRIASVMAVTSFS